LTRSLPVQGHRQDVKDLERHRRAAAYCDTWSSWSNKNHPQNKSDDERELLTDVELETLCPSNVASITDFRCKDEKGEPFKNKVNVTVPLDHYVFTCHDYIQGASCAVLDKQNGQCPDFSIQIYCNCVAGPRHTPTTLPAIPIPPTTQTSADTTSFTASSGFVLFHFHLNCHHLEH